jgi:hypothetical protein
MGWRPPFRDTSAAATPSQVARFLGVHVNTVKRIPSTDLPFFRVTARGDRRYRWPDIHDYERIRTQR